MPRNQTSSSEDIPLGGLTQESRRHLNILHRAFPGPFGIPEATRALDLDRDRTRKLLAYLTRRGWLTRIRRGVYLTVPLEASDPASWLADPWVTAAKLFEPSYIGGWTALNHWELTEQLFRSIVVFTARPSRSSEQQIQGTTFRVRQVDERRFFGLRTIWRERIPIQISDPERTLVDVLDTPELGGGIRHVADCVEEWARTETRDPIRLVQYVERHGNRTIFKRLGFLLEQREIDLPQLTEACRRRLSSGLSPLDPGSSAKGRILKRWQLRVNARVGTGT